MTHFQLFFFIFLFSLFAQEKVFAKNFIDDLQTTRDIIANEMQQVLNDEFRSWYPISIDTSCGGFFSDLNYAWKLDGTQNKMLVTQARHIWSTTNAGMFYQRDNTFRTIAEHGVRFLKDIMWDKEYGGFYDLVTRQGEPIKEDGSIIKRAYGNAFAIYGLAAYYRASGDTTALKLAQETFWWLEKHSYDSYHGGYFQFMSRNGTPFRERYKASPPKDQNSSIHILECFTELYKVWPDSTLKERLSSLLRLVRDTIATDKGYMVLFFQSDWTPVSYRDSDAVTREKNYEYDHISFGHDIEIAYLMLEASEALVMKNDSVTLKVAKKMVDHTLRNGWDKERGGIYDGGYYFQGEVNATIVRNTKEWWSQVEALNSLLMMSDLFPHDEQQYYEKFCIQWNYCRKYLIDQEHGGWYWSGVDIIPNMKYSPKSSIWKCNYHTSRTMINCINRIKSQTINFSQKPFEPVNKNATVEAKTILRYLYSMNGKRIVAGHHNFVGNPDIFIRRVRELTGKSPEIWGCDFINYYRDGEAEKIVREAYKKYKKGYIITLMWHAGRPQDNPPFGWKESVQAKMSDVEWRELITPGTTIHSRWLDQVDTVAKYLKELQTLSVPVLWRPYHELNGVWFWWGNRKGENGSARLYKMMFDRFVNFHKLNNLIWVWNTNAPRQLINDEAYAYEDYFPGLDYVDVLATDVYHNDYRKSHHDKLVELSKGKLIALGEVGEVPSQEILLHQPLWVWFMIWSNFIDTHNTPQQIRDLYSYPKILTHEDFMKVK